ncbi:hypothetical protein JQ614_32175 [Bradyrhizobium diazoefficiens]|uniref:hypothetical protein n=1 Tax=Bradyrhizobium diazoefficiens TaxID=1355477 RepID=UPI001B8D1D62|nr:hypothetical protein [Bradyrhizobium diazoefficiens]MBR0866288.1 hypothetical protein [Bradyrhizobium diazoefficiens]MBR0890749.1 hypothetical protein [Bradyrhizobium diazoefficiens]MBR0922582.1 hypothetical protein [Bradyrhizobium diazoefficiens]
MPIENNGSGATSETAPPQDRENIPATPFLVVPEDDRDDGFRPRSGAGWISSQSILLLNAKGSLETAPRFNESYRLLVLLQNLGAAPVQNGFAEFFLAPGPPLSPTKPAPFSVYQQTPLVQDQSWVNLGVSAFSLPSSSLGRGEIGWALSPGAWTPADLGPCAVTRAFEPISDGPGPGQETWKERKLAFRALNPNFAGTWTGTETDATTGTALGPVELIIIQNWNILPKGNHQAYSPACSVEFLKLPSLPPGIEEGIVPSMSGSMYYTLVRQGGTLDLKFTLQKDGSLKMELVRDGGTRRSTTSLNLTQAGTPPPQPNKGLLKRVRQVIPSYWPDQRKQDAGIVYKAINALGPL